MYSENLIGIKLNTPLRKVVKPFFILFAILDMFKHIIYDFYYNVLKNTFDNVQLLGQDTDSLIVQLNDKDNIAHKMCEMYKSFDFSELDNTSYFYGQLVNYYKQEVYKNKFPSFSSFLNFNKKLPGPIFKNEHNEHRITEFVGLRPKMYCLVDEKNVIHNAAKGVPRNVVIDGERMSVKNIDLYKRVLETESKRNAVIDDTFKRINNRRFAISTKEQTKTLKTCMDNKRWILDDNLHTLSFITSWLISKDKLTIIHFGQRLTFPGAESKKTVVWDWHREPWLRPTYWLQMQLGFPESLGSGRQLAPTDRSSMDGMASIARKRRQPGFTLSAHVNLTDFLYPG